MTNKKVSEMADEELNKAIIEEAKKRVKNGTIKSAKDAEDFIDNLVQPLFQQMLETELDNKLKYQKYEHSKENTGNYRNGHVKEKIVQTKYGAIKIKTPRDRNGEFEPVIIKKGENRLGKFEDIVLALTAKGMSYRDIEKLLKEIYGVNISKDQVQNFVNSISDIVEKWRHRTLQPFYTFIFADCLYIPVFDGLVSEKRAFYVIIGINAYGYKEVLGVWSDKTESASFWTSVFEDLKARGVEDILFCTSDGLAGFQGSLEIAFPKTRAQRCVVHLDRNLYKICPKKHAKGVLADFKKIYKSSNLEIAQLELENFEKKYKDNKNIVKKVKEDMQYIEPLFEYPEEIRHLMYTSNAVESVNSALRKVTNGKGSFATIDGVYKLFYLRIEELHEKWKKPVANWKKVQDKLIKLYGERYTKYLDI